MKMQFAIVLCSTVLLVACSSDENTAPHVPTGINHLQTSTLEIAAVDRELRFDGVIEAVNQATVAAQTSGRVTELPFDVGDYVKQGEVIVRITATEQKASSRGAEANLRAANAQLAEAQKQYARVKDLIGRKLVAQAEFDRAKAALDLATARANAANEALTQALAQEAYTEIKAPYPGIVVKRLVDVGETVTTGTPLMTGLSLDRLRAIVDIPQQQITAVRKFMRARVILPDGRSLAATGIRIPPNADAGSHTFRLLVTLPEGAFVHENEGIFPGTLVKVAFVAGNEQRLLLPPQALVQRAEITAAYVVGINGEVSLRYIRAGTPAADGRIPVLSGLAPGEKVALDPLAAGLAYRRQADSSAGNKHD
jgi:RND family efflux transporter MFP subunit